MEKKINPIYPNSQFKTFCYIKSVVTNPNIIVGDYSYYENIDEGPESFEKHVTHHYDFMGDKLIIGKFCSIARGVEFVMNGANHMLDCLTAYLIINILTNGSIALGVNLLFFVLSVVMALVLNFSVDMIVATICLYTESTWGINMVKECIVLLLSGASIPLAFFPAGLRNIVQYLPFRCIYDTPLSVLLQKNGYTWGTGLASSLLLQLAWCVVLGFAGAVFWRISLKKITVNGG